MHTVKRFKGELYWQNAKAGIYWRSTAGFWIIAELLCSLNHGDQSTPLTLRWCLSCSLKQINPQEFRTDRANPAVPCSSSQHHPDLLHEKEELRPFLCHFTCMYEANEKGLSEITACHWYIYYNRRQTVTMTQHLWDFFMLLNCWQFYGVLHITFCFCCANFFWKQG